MQRTITCGTLFLAVALAVALGQLAFKPHQRELSYLGKPVSYWVADGFTCSPSVFGRPPAEAAFRCMGSNAVPFLIATLDKTDGPLKQLYVRCYPKLPAKLRTRLSRPVSADALRGRAILALTLIGPTAKAAIPSLLNMLVNDPDGRRRANAVTCLDSIDNGDFQDEVLHALKRARSDPDPLVAGVASNTLKRRFPLGFPRLAELGIFAEGADRYEKTEK